MNIKEIQAYAQELRAAADNLDSAAATIAGLGDLPGISIPPTKPRGGTRSKRTPSPAGARRSIHHPNENDVTVLNAMLALNTDSIKAADVVESSGLDKIEVQKAIKWLNSSQNITTHGRGRGTYYTLNVTSNNLQVVDPSTLTNYRNPDGPKVVEIVRAIFNALEPMAKVSPAEVVEAAQDSFPDQNLERSSFGTVFSQMAKDGELYHEGEGRGRQYWRGPQKLENAADFPDGAPTIEIDNNDTDAEATG